MPAPDESPLDKRKRVLAYVLFALAAFALCLMLTFPYGALRARLVTEAAAQGWALKLGGLRPGLFGLTATDVRVSRPPGGMRPELVAALAGDGKAAALLGVAELGEPLHVDSLALRPSLFPLGVAFRAALLDGTVSGAVGAVRGSSVDVTLSDLNLSKGNLKGFSGMDMEGTLEGVLDLSAPAASGPGAAGADFSQAEGEVRLQGTGLLVKGGTVTVPMMGTMTPVDLPRIALGALDARIDVDKGAGKVQTLGVRGEDVTVQGEGTVKLARRLEYSEPDVAIRIKAEPAFVQRLGLIGSGLSILPPDKTDPSFRAARLSGRLGSPTFGPPPRGAR